VQIPPIENSIDPGISLPPFHTAESLRAHPRFQEAVACLVDRIAALYMDDRRLRGLIEYDRAVCFMLIVCLDAAQRMEQPESWLTLARLESILPVTRIEGGRRITELVAAMRRDGFLRSMPAPNDGRVRLLMATEKMLAADREWLAAFHAPLALLFGDEGYGRAVRQEAAYQRAFRRASLKTLPLADRIVGGNPAMDYFIRENVGTRILMVLMQSARGDPQLRAGPGFFSFAASRSAVSRTHVRNLARGAAALGLVELSTNPGDFVAVLPPLLDGVERWVAESLAGIDMVYRLAQQELDIAPLPATAT
jgi:hypothetical protein